MLKIIALLPLLSVPAYADTLLAVDRDGETHTIEGVPTELCELAINSVRGTASINDMVGQARSTFKWMRAKAAETDVVNSPQRRAAVLILSGALKSAECGKTQE
jgi:hypothetical protein